MTKNDQTAPDGPEGEVTDEGRRYHAVKLAIAMHPQGAGNADNLIAAAKKIESYLKGDA